MNDIPYQNIFDALQEVLPGQWHKVVFYAEYGESSFSMKYFVDLGDGEYVDCFKLSNISRREIIQAFSVIDRIILPARQAMSKIDTWSVMTLVVDDKGSFRAEYEYDDIAGNYTEYYETWKNKYLQ